MWLKREREISAKFIFSKKKKVYLHYSPMMPLSLLSSVEVGEVMEAWLEEPCLLLLLSSPPVGGCSVEQGEVLLLAKLEEGEILCGKEHTSLPSYIFENTPDETHTHKHLKSCSCQQLN